MGKISTIYYKAKKASCRSVWVCHRLWEKWQEKNTCRYLCVWIHEEKTFSVLPIWLSTLYNTRFGGGNGTPLQYSCLENPMDGGAWCTAVHGVARSRTRLSDFTFTFHFPLSCTGEGNGKPLQCSCLENPRDGEPDGLPCMGLHRVEHDWSDLAVVVV